MGLFDFVGSLFSSSQQDTVIATWKNLTSSIRDGNTLKETIEVQSSNYSNINTKLIIYLLYYYKCTSLRDLIALLCDIDLRDNNKVNVDDALFKLRKFCTSEPVQLLVGKGSLGREIFETANRFVKDFNNKNM